MRKLIDPRRVPVGGWRFQDPDTGFEFNLGYKTFEDLVVHVRAYRVQNELDHINNLKEVIEDWLCGCEGMGYQCTKPRTVMQYVKGAVGLVKQTYREFVSSEVAISRAKKCIVCPYNVKTIKKSYVERNTDNIMIRRVGNRKTDYNSQLGMCNICTCPLVAKIWHDRETVEESLDVVKKANAPRELFVDGKYVPCWLVEE